MENEGEQVLGSPKISSSGKGRNTQGRPRKSQTFLIIPLFSSAAFSWSLIKAAKRLDRM